MQAKGWNDDFCHGNPFYFALPDICDKSHCCFEELRDSMLHPRARLDSRGTCNGRAEVRLSTSVYFGIDCRALAIIAFHWSKLYRARDLPSGPFPVFRLLRFAAKNAGLREPIASGK